MSLLAAYGPELTRAAFVGLGFAAGAATGTVHFGTLRWAVRFFAVGSAVRAAALLTGRFALTGAAFTGLALLGAPPLLAGLAGLLLARQCVLHRAGGAA